MYVTKYKPGFEKVKTTLELILLGELGKKDYYELVWYSYNIWSLNFLKNMSFTVSKVLVYKKCSVTTVMVAFLIMNNLVDVKTAFCSILKNRTVLSLHNFSS